MIVWRKKWTIQKAMDEVNVEPLEVMLSHLRKHGCLDEVTEAQRVAEAVSIQTLETAIDSVKDYKLHFAMRDYLAAELKKDLSQPERGNIYLWADFEALWE